MADELDVGEQENIALTVGDLDAADNQLKEKVLSRRKRIQLDEQNKVEYLKRTLGTYYGRSVIYDILAMCGMFHSIVVTSDGLTLAAKVGRQNLGREILEKVLTSDPNSYSLMVEEHSARERKINGEDK